MFDWALAASHASGDDRGLPPGPSDEIEGLEVKTVPRLAELASEPRPLDIPLLLLLEKLFMSLSVKSSGIESRLVPLM